MSRSRKRTYPINQSPLYKLNSKKNLAQLLEIKPDLLRFLCRSDEQYSEWDEVTDKGKVRHIENPKPTLKKVQRKIAKLLCSITSPPFLHCPVKGRSYVTNAEGHKEGQKVKTIDIKSYFSSTTSRRVFWFFRTQLKCSIDVAAALTRLSTLNGHLPTGSSHSPILSFFAHSDIWMEIDRIARSANCRISIYMDDIAISGPFIPRSTLWEIKRAIHRSGLRYHKEKSYSGSFSSVTGVILRDGRLLLPNKSHLKMHSLRRELSTLPAGEARQEVLKRLRGCMSQARQISKANSSRPTSFTEAP